MGRPSHLGMEGGKAKLKYRCQGCKVTPRGCDSVEGSSTKTYRKNQEKKSHLPLQFFENLQIYLFFFRSKRWE